MFITLPEYDSKQITKSDPRAILMVAESAVILKRFYYMQRELIRMQAGWLPAIEHWESKLVIPEYLWQDSILAKNCRERILELRYPERRIEIEDDAQLINLLKSFQNAPNPAAFVWSLAYSIKPFILKLLKTYANIADPLSDSPTVFFLQHAISDLEKQIQVLQNSADDYLKVYPEYSSGAEVWNEGISRYLEVITNESLLGVNPPSFELFPFGERGGTIFRIQRIGARDRRFRVVKFAWPDRHTPGNPGKGVRLQVRQAIHHVNEVWAAEMASACIYDLMDRAPHEFLDDAARWCFDEIRHCRMGFERLKFYGFPYDQIPLDSFSYDAGQYEDAIVRVGVIFFFETTYIHTKPERAKIFGSAGDRLGSHDMDFDWADELIHTHYGKKWLDYFLTHENDTRSTNDIKDRARSCVERLQAAATEEDKETANGIVKAMLSRVEHLAQAV